MEAVRRRARARTPHLMLLAPLQELGRGKAAANGKQATGSAAAATPGTRSPAGRAPPASVKADEFKDQGNDLFKKGDYVKSIQMYTAAIALAPRTAVYYSNRAMAYLKLEQFERAIADCDLSIEIRWTAKAALRRGTARAAVAMWQEALDDFEAVVRAEPHNRAAAEQAEECRRMLATVALPEDGTRAPVLTEGLL